MRGLVDFLIVVEQTYLGLVYLYPVTLLLLAAWLGAFVVTSAGPSCDKWPLFWRGCLPPLAVPLAICLCGAVFAFHRHEVSGAIAPLYPQYLILGLFFGNLPLAALFVYRWRRQWPAVLASWAFTGYVSWVAAAMSSMSVTGVWL